MNTQTKIKHNTLFYLKKISGIVFHPLVVTPIAIIIGLFAFNDAGLSIDGSDFDMVCGVFLGLPLALIFSFVYIIVWLSVKYVIQKK